MLPLPYRPIALQLPIDPVAYSGAAVPCRLTLDCGQLATLYIDMGAWLLTIDPAKTTNGRNEMFPFLLAHKKRLT